MSIRTVVRKRERQADQNVLIANLDLCAKIRRSDPEQLLKIAADTAEQARQAGYDNILAQSLLYHAEACHRMGQHESTENLLRQADSIYTTDGSLRDRVTLWHVWGLHYLEIGDFLKAYDYLYRTFQWSAGTEDIIVRANVLNSLGLVFSRIGDYTTALQFYLEGLEIAQKLEGVENRSVIPSILTNIGSLYGLLRDYPKGLEYFERALAIRTLLNDSVGVAFTLKNMGTIHSYMENSRQAIECYEQAREIWHRIGNSKKEAHILASIGVAWGELGELDRALPIILESVAYAQRMHHAPEQAFALSKLGWVYQLRREYEKGIATFQETLQLAKELGLPDLQCKAHEHLAQLCEVCGDYRRGMKHQKLAIRIRNEIQGTRTQRSIAQIEIREALQNAEREKELLRQQAEQARQEIEARTKELNKVTLDLTQRNEMLKKIQEEVLPLLRAGEEKIRKSASGIIKKIEETQGEGQPIFQEQFERVYHEFIRSLRAICPELTATEIRICVLIKMNLSTKQIAEILFASPLTVKTHRTHIRRKLRLRDGESLTTLLFAL